MKSGKSHIERNLEEARRERERASSTPIETTPFALSEGGGRGAFVENTNEPAELRRLPQQSAEGANEYLNEGVLLRASAVKKPADAHTCPTPDIAKHELVVGDAWTCKCEQSWIVRPEGYAPNEKGKNKAYGAKWAKRRPRKKTEELPPGMTQADLDAYGQGEPNGLSPADEEEQARLAAELASS